MTDHTDAPTGSPDRPDRPGWYVDPRDAGRYRHWDGERWNELSATVPLTTEESVIDEPGRRRAVWPWTLGAAVVVALVAGTAVLVLDREDGGDAAAPSATTTSSPGTATTATTPAADPSPGTGPASADTTAPPTNEPGPEPTPTVAVDPVAPCVVDGEVLLQKLREHPPLASFADRLAVSDVKCAGQWATAVTAASDTDASLAVFEASGDDWTLLLLGSSQPCDGLGIPEESQPLLGCDFPGT